MREKNDIKVDVRWPINDRARAPTMTQSTFQQLLETTALLNSILESSTEYSIIAEDLEGRIVAWNEGARRSYGYSAEETIGRMTGAALHVPEDIASGRVAALLDCVRETGKAEGVFERVRKGGDRFTASLAATQRNDAQGAPIGYVVISKDISEQKALEAELLRKNLGLEELSRRSQHANRLKSEFLANMSHELRTPLNGIIGFAELMANGEVGPVSAAHKEYLGDILMSARYLGRLINDVLDLAKVEAGKIELVPERLDLRQVVSEVANLLRAMAAKKNIQLEVEVDDELCQGLFLDPAKLKQVLYNYISNALKFTGHDGKVMVRGKPSGVDHFRLEVADNGIGIDSRDITRLFVEFEQLDASSRKQYPGTGLGLALTKRIVEAQEGTVGVESTPGKGSVFHAILPRTSERAGSADETMDVPSHEGESVLVIEADREEREWIALHLRDAGFQVDAVGSAHEALLRADVQRYDLITLDLLLRDAPSTEVLRGLQASLSSLAAIVVVTVVAQPFALENPGVTEFLVKPIVAGELIGAVRRALRTVKRGGDAARRERA